MSVDVKWDGIRKLEYDLTKATTEVQMKSGQVIKNNTEELKRNTVSFAPRDTGFLKFSIIAEYPSEFMGVVHAEAAYAAYQEYGTRFMEAQPFLKPSYWSQYPKFRKDMSDLMKGAFK